MLLLCKGLQRITAHHQTGGTLTTGKVRELVTALCVSMERKFHRMEYNVVLSETTVLDPRIKKLPFNDNRAIDEAIQRVTVAISITRKPGGRRRSRDTRRGATNVCCLMKEKSHSRCYTGSKILSWGAPCPKSCRPAELVRDQGFSLPTTCKGDDRETVHCSNISPFRKNSQKWQILTERRNRIRTSKLRHLVFLNANLP